MNNSKISSKTPISIIVHGGNALGYQLTKTLVEQGSHVIVVDKFDSNTKKYATLLKTLGSVEFFDFKGLKKLYEKLERIDYHFYLLEEKLFQRADFDSKDFLDESDNLNTSLRISQKFKAKFTLISSLRLNRELANRVNNEKISRPSPYSNIELQKYCETLVAEFTDKNRSNTRIVRIGTLLGKNIEGVTDPVLDKLLSDGTKKTQIEIIGEGLDNHNLIHESDAVYGILKLTFSPKTEGEVITLSNRNDYTTLSLAYKLLELNVEAGSIKFVESKDSYAVIQDLYVPAPHANKYGWKQQVSLEKALIEEIQTYYEKTSKVWELGKEEDIERRLIEKDTKTREIFTPLGEKLNAFKVNLERRQKDISKKEINVKKVSLNILSVVLISLFVYFIGIPLTGLSLGGFLTYRETKALYSSIQSLDFDSANTHAKNVLNHTSKIESILGRTSWIFKITGGSDLHQNLIQLVVGSQYAFDGLADITESLEPLAVYAKDFQPALDFQSDTPSTTREYREYLSAIEEKQYMNDEAVYKINLANELIENIDTTVFPNFLQNSILQIKDTLNSASKTIEPIRQASYFLPDLLGLSERKRYLILLQNDGEIRSSGGWVTSYAVLGIEGGQIRELYVDDIYNADGTLSIQGKRYKTPATMESALDLEDWKFSTVNWDPDLYKTLQYSEIFIEDLGKGDDLDGIVTVDTTFLQKVLSTWGGIEVSGETDLVTSENLYTKIFEMHTDFTPGSSRKATFLANLADEIIKRIFSSNFEGYKELGDVFVQSLDEKHIQATFKNAEAFNYFGSRDWNGAPSIENNEAPFTVEWNWGGNKANMYLKKTYTLDIDIKDEDTIDFDYNFSIENQSTENTYPQGDYENYLRVYLPKGSQLLGISGFENNEYSEYAESNFSVVGGWFNIPIQTEETLNIKYRITRESLQDIYPLSVEDDTYTLETNIFKQPGTKKDSYKVDITYPSTWTLVSSEGLTNISNQLTRRFDFISDEEFEVIWKN